MNTLKFGSADVTRISIRSPKDETLIVKWFNANGNLVGETNIDVRTDMSYEIFPLAGASYYQIQRKVRH